MTMRLLLASFLLFALLGCQDDDDNRNPVIEDGASQVTGFNYVNARGGNVDTIYRRVLTALTANDQIGIVAEVDHAANAASVGEELDPTRLVLFGNPRLGTPLMQINPQAGLDLPQKILVYAAGQGNIVLGYNSPNYLANRHGVGAAATLTQIRDALGNLAQNSTGGILNVTPADEVQLNEGIISYTATGSVDSVYSKLRSAVAQNAELSIVAELDHQANAASVGLELPAIRLLVFGNPGLGTPLLQYHQSVGIDLPQKMLVYDAGNGEVTVSFNDPYYIANRHGLNQLLPELRTIETALNDLAKLALR